MKSGPGSQTDPPPRLEDIHAYQQANLGRRYREAFQTEAGMEPTGITADMQAALSEDGYLIIENVIPVETCESLKATMMPLFRHASGRNNFEGLHTQRIYSLIEKTPRCNPWIEHPLALALTEHVLEPAPLLSQAQIINILPGESAQPLHYDDGFYRWPRPRPPLGAATIFALDAFSEENGATMVIPGSHRWDGRLPGDAEKSAAIPAVMPQGSMLFFVGTLWHAGGANRSGHARMCLTAQYCVPWCRPQENFFLSVRRETAKQCSGRMRQLLGYSIHKPFMGMVDGMHPLRLLDD